MRWRWPASPIIWLPTNVTQKPRKQPRITAHGLSPTNIIPAARVYCPMLCMQANQTEVMLKAPQRRSVLGARSSLYSRGLGWAGAVVGAAVVVTAVAPDRVGIGAVAGIFGGVALNRCRVAVVEDFAAHVV